MARFAAFLRGMNVGGHRLTNDQLRACFRELGFGDVACFRASGNVVFSGEPEPDEVIAAHVEEGLQAALGYAVPTFIRDASEVRAIAELQPFAAELVEGSDGKLQVSFLSSPPAARARKNVLSMANDQDRLAFGERELYWLPSGRMLETTLDLKAIERLLGPLTMRTKNTVEQIAAKHFAE
jgi:uncharacterized protein (DUF1697 family)